MATSDREETADISFRSPRIGRHHLPRLPVPALGQESEASLAHEEAPLRPITHRDDRVISVVGPGFKNATKRKRN